MPNVLKVCRGPEPTTGKREITKTVSANETRTFHVTFDSAVGVTTIAAQDAYVSPTERVPPYGDNLPDTGYYLLSKTATQLADPFTWLVVCEYRVPDPSEESKPDDTDATPRWGIEISGSSASYDEAVNFYEKTVDGATHKVAIVNATGDLVNGYTERYSDEELVVAFTCVQIPWDAIKACLNRANDAAVTLKINGQNRTIAAKTMRLQEFSHGVTLASDAARYPRVNLRFLIRYDTWQRQIPNRSYYHYVGTGDAKKKVRNTENDLHPGVFLSEPQDVDLSGHLVEPGTPIDEYVILVPPKTADFTDLLKDTHT